MQDSKEYGPSNSKFFAVYTICFVTFLTFGFLYVMFVSLMHPGAGDFEEKFLLQDLLIQNFNRIRLKIGDRVFNNVLIGKNGWMEFTDLENLDDYQNARQFSPQKLEALAATIQSCHQFAQRHDFTFWIVVAPNKASIYPDKVPEQIRPLSPVSRLDQLNAYLQARNIPQILDLRPALREARQDGDVYYKLGTHWNHYGAYVAYDTIINSLSQKHPGLVPYPAEFFRFRSDHGNQTDLEDEGIARLIRADYLEETTSLFATRRIDKIVNKVDFPQTNGRGFYRISWIPESDLPSLMLLHDSFGHQGFNEFLSLNFSRVSYFRGEWFPRFLNPQLIEQFSPDIVIYEVVERGLDAIQRDLVGCTKE